MNIDFDEDKRKLPTKSFLKIFKGVINLPLAQPNFIVISTPCDKFKKHILKSFLCLPFNFIILQ